MDTAEYANLARVEREHWYYAGKREVVRYWLERAGPPRPEQTLLDCGAGTGLFAAEMAGRCRVLVLDDHEEALRLLRERFGPEQVLRLESGRVPQPAASVDYVTALDVLEHVRDDAAAVAELARVLKPGGVAVVTAPAGLALWSDWDVALHHYRRYGRAQLRGLFPEKDWEIVHLNHTNVLVYPAVWVVRKWRGRRGAGERGVRPEDRLLPRWLNALLRVVFVGMARWRVPLPFGVSLLLVARRRG
jgi:2-polyprenyl-3-methyl-5-hydroxy-6-metoxy-1,4-benzoquinol methylase